MCLFYIAGSFKAVQGLECFILVLMFIIVLIAAVYVATERFREMAIAVVIAVMCFLTGEVLQFIPRHIFLHIF
jgi:hypothetical protein